MGLEFFIAMCVWASALSLVSTSAANFI
jgi:hypothetical protein